MLKLPKNYTITFEIDEKTGEISAKLKGVKGKACSDIMRFLDDAGLVLIDAPTEEYYAQEEERLRVAVKS
jgi:hypothetical protein